MIIGRIVVALVFVGLAGNASAGLKAFYTFEDSLNNVVGSSFHGIASNGPAFVAGYEGKAIGFDAASNQYVTFAGLDINPDVMPQITFGGWFLADSGATIQGVLSHDDGDFDRTLDIDSRGDVVGWSAFTGNGVKGGLAVAPNVWTFMAVRHDQASGEFSLFVDGAKVAATGVSFGRGQTSLTLGRNPSFDLPFSGRADNVFVFDELVSNQRISDIRELKQAALLPVPEPETYALLLAGLGLLVAARARAAGVPVAA